MPTDRITVPCLRAMKARGERITMVTAYDATFARLLDAAGVEVLLVGDSLGMVVQGLPNTLPVTLDEVVYHTRAVRGGCRRATLVADMPFGSYQAGPADAVRSAARLLKEGGAEAVKLEGGTPFAEAVQRCTEAGIPVMGHLGLTPQSIHAFGGFRIQGRTAEAARRLVEDAQALAAAGAFAIVLEGMPREVAAEITRSVAVPTIGIGAGPHCDGQVLVCYDLLGMDPSFSPRFVKRYAELASAIRGAVEAFRDDVRAGAFPADEHSVSLADPAPRGGQGSPLRAVTLGSK